MNKRKKADHTSLLPYEFFCFIVVMQCFIQKNFDSTTVTEKLTSLLTAADKAHAGLVKLLCIIIFDISKIKPKFSLGLVKAWCHSHNDGKICICICWQAYYDCEVILIAFILIFNLVEDFQCCMIICSWKMGRENILYVL